MNSVTQQFEKILREYDPSNLASVDKIVSFVTGFLNLASKQADTNKEELVGTLRTCP